ncbi:trehalose-phosphatase-domain-containing protein [Fennellomyces sp. T-0311]|nr:trehalose-phosphatase-domain-containing protein [Fennellomyces sp. T-0311]
MTSIIHVALTTDTIVELPPSPPQSPPKQFAQLFSTNTIKPTMWTPSWHVIHDAMATYQEYNHQVVAINDKPPSYITNTLDPLFQQCILSTPQDDWNAFVALCEKWADQIVERYRSHRDIIWIHDYPLALLPGIVRRKLPHAIIGFAIYSRFPNLDNLKEHGRTLLHGMLAADLIGLQSTTMPMFSAAHIALLQPTVHLKSVSSEAQARSRAIRQLFRGQRIVLCQDTEAAGVFQTLAAVEHYLSVYDTNVVFIHICTKASIPQPLHAVPELVRQINQLYGSPQCVPIHFYHQDLDMDEYDALLTSADVALVMGLHPHATLAAQTFVQRRKDKPLIVSQGSPVHTLAVDPSNTKAVAAALHNALSTPYRPVASVPNTFLQKLAKHTPVLNVASLTDAYRTASKRLFLFDYDGTLTPIVSNPDAARPSRQLLLYLQALCNDPQNTVWVVSGRDQATLEAWLGNTVHGMGLSAEHGSFMKLPGESWQDMLASADMSWKTTALAIFQKYTAKTPGTVVEQKKSSITWHYRNALDAELALAQCEACFKDLQSISGVDILRGKMNLEVRSILVNKGNVVQRIQQSVGADFILCAGDDRTDEDMFHALKDHPSFCVLIGPQDKETEATWCVDSSEKFVGAVGKLAAISSAAASTL